MAKSESLRLSQDLRQQQTLAPMQLQYVKMLEMNSPEVEEEVRRVLDENPALEPDESDDSFPTPAAESTTPYYRLNSSNRSADDPVFEPESSDTGESLMDHLLDQLSQDSDLSDRDMEIARFIIGNIDPNGYLTRPLRSIADDIAIQGDIDPSDDEIRAVWKTVRNLEPAGIGAIDLRDSLLLQLLRKEKTPAVILATEIVRDYFDVFSLMHYNQLRTMLRVSENDLRDAIDTIRSLNPKPGAQIGGGIADKATHIAPDFFVETDSGDRLTLSLLNNIPSLRIARSFAADSAVEKKNPAAERANAFIRQRRDEASGFIRALTMRQATLFRVVSAIMQWQREFFLNDDDPARLRPMILKDISRITGDDISVISRATAGKYLATNHGVYPLRFFFNEARENDDAASPMIMARLKQLIDNEDKHHPLTDQALTEALRSEGINIARRTVAKYREKMGVPVGRLRKTI